MASAIQINAAGSIVAGHGLSASPDLVGQITTLKNHQSIYLTQAIFDNVTGTPEVSANVLPILTSMVSGIGLAGLLIDIWPANITPTATGTVSYYAGTDPALARYSSTLLGQAQLPFTNGTQSFASVFGTAYSDCVKKFDSSGSIAILTNTTYGDAGIGHAGPLDSATGGIGSNGPLLADVVANWGTMYDVTNITSIGDPYVFGQNLLNQGLGAYGDLSTKLTSVGLDVSDITNHQSNTVTKNLVNSNIVRNSAIGSTTLPVVNNLTFMKTSAGTNTNVVLQVYAGIAGTNLKSITTATQFTPPANATLNTLADYLDFSKVIDTTLQPKLYQIGITDFKSLGAFLSRALSGGTFKSWAEISSLLAAIHVPVLVSTGASSRSNVLLPTAVNAITTATGATTGSGSLGHHVMADYLGATCGIPHTNLLETINLNFNTMSGGVVSALNGLGSSVNNYKTALLSALASNLNPVPTTSSISTSAASVKTALQAVQTSSGTFTNAAGAYIASIQHHTQEVLNLANAGVSSSDLTGTPSQLLSFAQGIGSTASDSTQYETYQFFANLSTKDIYGDTVRLAISESINSSLLSTTGMSLSNSVNPTLVLQSANDAGQSVGTYIKQNINPNY